MRLILIAFALLATCFLFIFTREALPHRGCSTWSSVLHIWEFALEICRGNLSQEFAVGICCRNLPWLFAASICRGFFCIYKRILFCICEQILFIWRQTFFICVQNFLICEIFFINSASSCYCRGSYGPPYLLSQAHTPNCYKILKVITITTSWCSLNIIYPMSYAVVAVLSVWHHQNYGQLQYPFLGLFSIQSGPFIIHR